MMTILKQYQMRQFYLPQMPGLAVSFYVHLSLMRKYLPKLHTHLLNSKYEPSMYAS